MTTPEPPQITLSTPLSAIRTGLQLLPHALTLCILMCSGFTALVSIALAVALPWAEIAEESAFYARLGGKALLFSGLTLVAWQALRILMRGFPPRLLSTPLAADGRTGSSLALLLVCFLLLQLPRLTAYPWTAPDELHHLTVTRNLATHGEYASGHPQHALVRYDVYDSVGPAVLVPAATGYRLFEDGLEGARFAMVLMFLGWLLLSWLLLRPIVGPAAACGGVALAGTAIGSIYLGRTLYGEVPALMYATAGLLYWRMALGRRRHLLWSAMAGTCFALSVLAKTFMVLTVFPVAAVFLFDQLSFKRIPGSRILWPGLAAGLTLASWSLVKVYGGGDSNFAATLDLYRHYLLFGLGSVDTTLLWIGKHWVNFGVIAVGLTTVLPLLLLVRYDPPTLVLALTGILFAYWWIFFTPGQIPRYLWYTLATGGLFSGSILLCAINGVRTRKKGAGERVATACFVLFLLLPSAREINHVVRQMWFTEQMSDEYALRDLLETLPNEPVVTTSWMAQRSANFFLERHLPLIAPDEVQTVEAYVIRDLALEEFDASGLPALGSGRYLVIPPQNTEISP